jgi:hypothetical protein
VKALIRVYYFMLLNKFSRTEFWSSSESSDAWCNVTFMSNSKRAVCRRQRKAHVCWKSRCLVYNTKVDQVYFFPRSSATMHRTFFFFSFSTLLAYIRRTVIPPLVFRDLIFPRYVFFVFSLFFLNYESILYILSTVPALPRGIAPQQRGR